ncbi:DUF2268 domain-containing putative Zn-dependent protease [Mucilaginibacter sp.]
MKKFLFCIAACLMISVAGYAQKSNITLVYTDVDNFWKAYDRIVSTKDSALQYHYLNQYFISKATPGLKAMMQVRDYTPKDYVEAINSYPLFWNSLRPNTYKTESYANAIAANVDRLKALYPDLKPAEIYFVMGAFRSPGTTQGNRVLIGSETAMADERMTTSELSKTLPNTAAYIKTSPIRNLVFTNVHEYVHTQQKTTVGDDLLAQCTLEGVAEFMAEKATGQPSTLQAIVYGNNHAERVKEVFAQQMFNRSNGFWLYSNAQNEFGVRDLGYYVGYAICKNYYNRAKNKKQAIKDMITLDYNDAAALQNFTDQSGYFTVPVANLKDKYEARRPAVTGIAPFANNSTSADADLKQLTINFSVPMNTRYRNFELGPLGKDHLLKIKSPAIFSADGKSLTLEVELQPGQP